MQMMQAMSVEMDALYTAAWLLKALALWLPSDGQLSNAVYFRRFFSRLHINPSASMACLLTDRSTAGLSGNCPTIDQVPSIVCLAAGYVFRRQ